MCGRYSLAADLEDIQQRFELFASDPDLLAQVQHRAHAAGAGRYELRRETARVPALGSYSFLGQERLGGQPPYQCTGRDRSGTPEFPLCIGEAAVSGHRRRFLRMAEGRKSQKAHAGRIEVGRTICLCRSMGLGDPAGDIVRSCTIITTEPNELLRPIHNRMPFILPEELESF